MKSENRIKNERRKLKEFLNDKKYDSEEEKIEAEAWRAALGWVLRKYVPK